MKSLLIICYSLFFGMITYGQSPYIHHVYEKVATPNMTESIDFLDIDNDGDEDLVNYVGNGIVRIYRSNGSWIDSLDYIEAPISGGNCIVADWNNDNLPDFLSYYGGLQLTENIGNFTFAPPVIISPSTMYNIDTAHIDGDVYVDAFSFLQNSISFYINQSGTLATTNYSIAIPYNMDNSKTVIRFNDIENDGLKEMFVKAASNKIYIYTQTGSMDYTLQDSIVSNSIGNTAKKSMYFYDLNNDGQNEIIIRNGVKINIFQWTSGYSYTLVYSGNIDYQAQTGSGNPDGVEIYDFYDIDQNGYLDIVVGNSVFFNNGNFSFNGITINNTSQIFEGGYKCTDIDNNGKTDICYVSNSSNSYSEEAFFRRENTSAQTLDSKSLIWYYWGSPNSGDVLDYDNDGDADVISFNMGKIILWENINDTLYPKRVGSGLNYFTDRIDVVDINQDSFLDLLWNASDDYSSSHGYRLNNGSEINNGGNFSTTKMILKLIADIDGDGIEELFYHLKSGSTNNYVYMYRLNTGLPVLASTVLYWTDYDVDDVVIRLGDYDLDGLKDVIIQHESMSYNKIRLAHNNGSNTFSAGQVLNVGANAELLGVFDSNCDLYPDIHFHISNNKIYRYENNGGAYTTAQVYYTLPSGTFASSNGYPTDFDNDLLTDLFVQSDTKQWILKNNGYGLQLIHTEAATKRISRVMDVDNDGDIDFVANDEWYENTSTSDYFTSGSVYYDINTNGVFDQGIDVMLPLFPIELNNNWLTSYTDTNGYFNMPLGSTAGNYNISIGSAYASQFNATTLPYPSVATVNVGNPVDSVSIGVTNVNNIIDGTLDVTLSGHRCNEIGRLFLQVQNLSPENVELDVKVKLAANTSFSSSNLPVTQVADTLIWHFTGMNPFEMDHFYVDINMPGTALMGDTMHFYTTAEYTGSLGSQSVMDTLNQILTCGYDPNDKNISMTDYVYFGDVTYSFRDETEYLIRFQNTGNDTATNIVVRDQLSNLFDWSTVRPISASHSFNFTIDTNGMIEVKFNNIQLPDSSVNFLGSMGYIKFKVDYASTSPTFVPVNNHALIYFDQNPPVLTNINKFLRADCIDFINIPSSYSVSRCFVDTLQISNNDYGLPFSYQWTKGAYVDNTEEIGTIPFETAGLQNYSLTISGFGCSADTTMSLVLKPIPNLVLSVGDTTLCPNSTITVNSNLLVNWYQNGQSMIYPSNNFPVTMYGDVHLTAITNNNSYGCKATVNIFLEVIKGPSSFHSLGDSTQNVLVCLEDSIVVTSNYDSLIWNVNYVFGPQTDFNDTSMVLTIPIDSSESRIILTSTMNYLGCNINQTKDIQVLSPTNNHLSINNYYLSFQAEDTNYYCNQGLITISGRYVDWYFDGNYVSSGNSINATQSGMYTWQDSCGFSSWFVIMNQNSVSSVENVSVCLGSTYIAPNGHIFTNVTAPFTYYSYLTSQGGCDSTVTTYVTILSPISSTENVSVCKGSTYTAPDGVAYTNVSVPFTHVSNLSSLGGCDSIVTTNVALLSTSLVTDLVTACNSYTWIDGNTYTTSTNTPTLNFTNVAGCDSIITLDLTINSLPDVSVSQSGSLLSANQVGAYYQWLDCDDNNNTIPGESDQVYVPTNTGNYAVEINLNGCIDTSTCFLVDYTGLSDLYKNKLSLNPNPTDKQLFILGLGEVSGLHYIQVISTDGKLQFQTDGKSSEFDVSHLAPGEYFIRIFHEQGVESLRFIKR